MRVKLRSFLDYQSFSLIILYRFRLFIPSLMPSMSSTISSHLISIKAVAFL